MHLRVKFIETKIAEHINHTRFVPYIQLHEFESLLFTDLAGFIQLDKCGPKQLTELQSIIDRYPNPELINDGPETAPSKRLQRIIPGYEKPFYGEFIALENGLDAIISKCPRFRNWMELLTEKVKE